MGNGEFRPPGEPKLLNRLRWNLARVIMSMSPPHTHKRKIVNKGGRLGVGVKFSPQTCFFLFLVTWTDLQLTR